MILASFVLNPEVFDVPALAAKLDRRYEGRTGRSALGGWRDKMCTLADRVRLSQPRKELVVEFVNGDDPEVVHEEAPRVRTGTSDASVLDATL